MFTTDRRQLSEVLMRLQDEEQYRITARVWFRWRTSSGDWREGTGSTRHIRGAGLFVLAYPVPVPGAPISVRVEIPPSGVLTRSIVLRGQGTVTRVEPETGQPLGFDASVIFEDEW